MQTRLCRPAFLACEQSKRTGPRRDEDKIHENKKDRRKSAMQDLPKALPQKITLIDFANENGIGFDSFSIRIYF
jgi:hypothetical protein